MPHELARWNEYINPQMARFCVLVSETHLSVEKLSISRRFITGISRQTELTPACREMTPIWHTIFSVKLLATQMPPTTMQPSICRQFKCCQRLKWRQLFTSFSRQNWRQLSQLTLSFDMKCCMQFWAGLKDASGQLERHGTSRKNICSPCLGPRGARAQK